jgi:hypothetical protein
MQRPRIYADFQNLDDFNRLRLTSAGTLQDLARERIELREGLVLTFWTDDEDDEGQADQLRAEGIVQFNVDEKCWVAAVNWSAPRPGNARETSEPVLQKPSGSQLP